MSNISSVLTQRIIVAAAAVGAAVIALAATGAFAASAPASTSDAPFAASSPETTTNAPGPLTQSKADSVARLFASEIAGDGSPTSQESVATNRKAAVATLMAGSGAAHNASSELEERVGAEHVFVETMRGHFTLQTSVRPGAPLPTGTSLTVFLSAETGYVVGVDVSNEAPEEQTLSRLGSVEAVG